MKFVVYCCFVFFISSLIQKTSGNLRKCKKEDFIYTYTECQNNTRWRVAVPGADCGGGTVHAPSKPNKCDFQCGSGKRLSAKTSGQHCEDCPGGTYSIRGGLRIDEWEVLPAGFTSTGERSEKNVEATGVDCSDYKWVPSGDFLASPSGAACQATLSYTVNMAKAGHMEMMYKYTESGTLFTVEVQNDKCQVNSNPEQDWVSPTGAKRWKLHKVKLGKGRNRIFIVLINDTASARDSNDGSPIAMIRSVEFHNVAFDQTCTKCRAGTHATSGATKCAVCKENTFSGRGAAECTPCSKDTYSLPGSDSCKSRPKCKATDYFFSWSPCDASTGKMTKMYAWIEPKVCVGGIGLPKSVKEFRDCTKDYCNAGSYRVNATTCAACPPGQLAKDQSEPIGLGNSSDATAKDSCVACRINSQPVHDIIYNRWWSMPPNMTTLCITMGIRDSMSDCPSSGRWQLMGDYIRSGYGVNSWFSVLKMSVLGFNGKSGDFSGHLSFEFQLRCQDRCKFYFMMDSENTGNYIAHQWNEAKTGRKQFNYWLRHKGPTTFMWIFERPTMDFDSLNNSNTDYVAIYNINATHVKGSPASACERCPLGVDKRCVPCPNGQFFDSMKGHCFPCPPGHVVWRTPARSVKDCRACGPGLRPHNGNSCVVDFTLTTKVNGGTKAHDLRALKGNQTLSGVLLFTTRGTKYHHVFVFTIDNGQKTEDLPQCLSNLTTFGQEEADIDQRDDDTPLRHREVRSLICQYTIVPPRKKGGHFLSAQPGSLGDRLVNVTSTNHSAKTFEHFNRLLEQSGWPRDDDNLDLHFTYVTEDKSYTCPNSRSTVITLRCDPKTNTDRGEVFMPPKCPDGTCDGCNFHFMWKSRAACPICVRTDYEKVKGECSGGKQLIHYYPPKHCYFSVKEKHEKIVETVHCPLISSEAEISIIVVMVVGFILVTLLGYFWKRNRRLEYKYMKLVEGKGGQPGELPQAESCAVHEGEEEDDDVHIKSSGGTSSAFFSRFKQFKKTNTFGGDRMETVNLTDRDEFGL